MACPQQRRLGDLMSKVLVIGGHGMGDCLMSLQCAQIIKDNGIEPTVVLAVRDEIFEPLDALFGSRFNLKLVDETYAADNNLLKDESLFKFISEGFDEVYYVIPDLLFNNKHSFDFLKYNTSPQMIRSTRLLDKGRKVEKIIYMGLMSTTPGYMYGEPLALALAMAYSIPTHTIYFPVVTKWAGKDIKPIILPNKAPNNLQIVTDPDMKESMAVLGKSCYFVGTDNGPSHLAYHYGMPRLLLDPQFNKLPWIARWREDYLESVPISSPIEKLVDVVNINISTPQTTLVPRMTCLVHGLGNWEQLLWLKTQ
jgi:hypothetical protein